MNRSNLATTFLSACFGVLATLFFAPTFLRAEGLAINVPEAPDSAGTSGTVMLTYTWRASSSSQSVSASVPGNATVTNMNIGVGRANTNDVVLSSALIQHGSGGWPVDFLASPAGLAAFHGTSVTNLGPWIITPTITAYKPTSVLQLVVNISWNTPGVPSPPASPNTLVIEDPGFENASVSPWSVYSPQSGFSASVTALISHSGARCLEENGGSAQGVVFQDISGLTPGQIYEISAWVVPQYTSAYALLSAHDTNGANLVQVLPLSRFQQGGISLWQQVSLLYIADDTGKVRIQLVHEPSGGPVFWDDVAISEFPLNGVSPSIIRNLTDQRVFDPQFYLGLYSDLSAAFGNDQNAALRHWLTQGLPVEGRRGAQDFDVALYLNLYPDLRAAFGTNYDAALDHWLQQGLPVEGRRGSLEFDPAYYVNLYPDLKAAFGTDYTAAESHWRLWGLPVEGRRGSVDFDVVYYLDTYPDLKAAFGTNYQAALNHWIMVGRAEGRKGAP
jgi:hypothetical protein